MLVNLQAINAICANTDPVLTTDRGLSIKGATKVLGDNARYIVNLFEKSSGRLIANQLSDGNGNYEFSHLTNTKFFLIAHHPASQFNAVIQDNVVPK